MSTIAASNTAPITITPDTSGNLVMTATSSFIDTSGNTGVVSLPSGTTNNRPTVVNGMIRYNTTTARVEAYLNDAWANIV